MKNTIIAEQIEIDFEKLRQILSKYGLLDKFEEFKREHYGR